MILNLAVAGIWSLALAFMPEGATGREFKDVTMEINSAKKGADAKQDAFDQAVERATREMTEDIMGADKAARAWEQIKAKILKNSTKYVVFIKGSAPLEAKGQSQIQVQMRLSPDHLEKALREAGLYGGETVRLLPLVQVAEPQGSRYSWWADLGDNRSTTLAQGYFKKFFQQMNSQFKGKNVHVLDPLAQSFRMGLPASYRTEHLRREDQILLGQYLNADVVLSGRVLVSRPRSDAMEHRIDYVLELWQTKTGRSLVEVSQSEIVSSDNPKAIQAAMDQVQPKAFSNLAVKLQEVVSSGNLNLSVVRISLEGNLTPRQLNEFKKLLGSMREIRLLRERLLEPFRTTFESETSVGGAELAKAIQKTRFPHFQVEVTSGQDDRLVLVVKTSGPSSASAQ